MDRKTWLAAHAAKREAGAALRWTTANHEPIEQPLATAYAVVLLYSGRVREGGAITEQLLASPPADAETRCVALCAHSTYVAWSRALDAARRCADQAYLVAPDARTRCRALIRRGLSNLFGGHTDEAVTDHVEATALAREVHSDPVLLTAALMAEAQALTSAGLLEEAGARFDEAHSVGSPVDAYDLSNLDTGLGDLAIADGRPADALEPYARSLEMHLADGSLTQLIWDLFGVAEALAALGHESESLEVAGIAKTHGAELGATADPTDYEHLVALEKRIGPTRAGSLNSAARHLILPTVARE